MEVTQLSPGLWRWTAYHEKWKKEVACHYVEAPGEAVVLVDPLVPAEEPDRERFWRSLDRDVERVGRPVHVLITVFFHTRSAREVLDRYDARLWARSGAERRIANRGGSPAETFSPGDPLPAGILAFDTGRVAEVVYWIPQHRALVVGDVLLGSPFRLCPKSWLERGSSQAELRAALRPLLELHVERVLVSHGEPVLENGHGALTALLEDEDAA